MNQRCSLSVVNHYSWNLWLQSFKYCIFFLLVFSWAPLKLLYILLASLIYSNGSEDCSMAALNVLDRDGVLKVLSSNVNFSWAYKDSFFNFMWCIYSLRRIRVFPIQKGSFHPFMNILNRCVDLYFELHGFNWTGRMQKIGIWKEVNYIIFLWDLAEVQK